MSEPRPPQPGDPTQKPEAKKEIPLSWFTAMGRKDSGISSVLFSGELLAMGGGEVERRLVHEYSHHMGNTMVQGKIITDSSQIPDESKKAIVESASRRVKEITGFSAEELCRKQLELSRLFRDKQEAPFKVELF